MGTRLTLLDQPALPQECCCVHATNSFDYMSRTEVGVQRITHPYIQPPACHTVTTTISPDVNKD